jgi:hypothetical protein
MTVVEDLNDNHKSADDTLVLEQPPQPCTTDQAAELFKAEGDGKVEAWVKVKKRSADAERKETHREKLKKEGLGQLNLVVPIEGPARELLHQLAKADLDAARSEAVRTVAENQQIAELSVRLGSGPEPDLKCLTPRLAVHILRPIDQEPSVRAATSAVFKGGHIAGLVRCLCQDKLLVERLHLVLSDHRGKQSGGFFTRARALLSLALYLWRRGR